MPFGDMGGMTAGGYKPPAYTTQPDPNPAATNQPVTAPQGSLLSQLQQQRQGATQYGSIAQGLQNPEVLALLASGFAPMGLARTQLANATSKQAGTGNLRQMLAQIFVPNTRANTLIKPQIANYAGSQYAARTQPAGPSGPTLGQQAPGVRGLPTAPQAPKAPGGATAPQYSTPSYGF